MWCCPHLKRKLMVAGGRKRKKKGEKEKKRKETVQKKMGLGWIFRKFCSCANLIYVLSMGLGQLFQPMFSSWTLLHMYYFILLIRYSTYSVKKKDEISKSFVRNKKQGKKKKKVLDFVKLEYYKEVLDFHNIEYHIAFLII